MVPSEPDHRLHGAPENGRESAWKSLRLLCLYRLGLTLLLALLFFSHPAGRVLGGTYPKLYAIGVSLYVVFSMIVASATFRRRPLFETQVTVQIVGDIAMIVVLMHASGGVLSGLGAVLVVALAGGGLLLPGRAAYTFASLAAVAVLAETGYLALSRDAFHWAGLGHAGLLGAAFFAAAAMTHLLAQRTRETEALAARQEVDLANLTQLNDYVVQKLDAGIIVVDRDHTIRLINARAATLLDLTPDCAGAKLARLVPVLEHSLLLWQRHPTATLAPFRPAAGKTELQPRFQRLGEGVLILLDDPHTLARQSQQVKLAALGRLTASIAHEIRNPLGAISHAGQLLAESPDIKPADRRMTEIIRQQCGRVDTIVESLLALSRRRSSQGQDIDLDDWLTRFAAEFRRLEKPGPATLSFDVQSSGTSIHFDSGHLHQIVWNLCENALEHARPESGGPVTVALRTGHNQSGEPCLDVADNGAPIPEEVQKQLFEPFYTTASTSTGLGLYIARELCEHNQARLEFEADPATGNRFRIVFAANRRTPI